jgi:8-oxo-dGTP pyrophosphatase MutT (NUDIX family)
MSVPPDPLPNPLDDAAHRDPRPAQGRPKDAATLILVRRDGPAPRILMGRRGPGHVFMPDKWVFPGGRLDRGDFRTPVLSELRPETAAVVERTAAPARARALAVAAVRETWEEAGVVLGRLQSGRVLPDLAALDMVAHAVTPPGRVRRFDARFFSADASALESIERTPGTGELEEIAWFTLPEALALDLPSITRFVVAELGCRESDPARPVPSVRMLHGKPRTDPLLGDAPLRSGGAVGGAD